MYAIELSFLDEKVQKIVDGDGVEWMTADDAGRCLGYSESGGRSRQIRKIIQRHPEEFKGHTCRPKLGLQGQQVREYLLLDREALMTLGFFAKTAKASGFRMVIRKFFLDPRGGYQKLLQTIETQQAMISELQNSVRQSISAMSSIASSSAKALALYRWHKPDNPNQLPLKFIKVEEIKNSN